MRLGVRGKEALAVTLLTFLIVATTTLIHLAQLSRVVVQEAERQAELIGRQIYAQAARALSRAPRGDPRQILRRDRELRGFLDASVGYSPHLLYALIADRAGRTLVHTERAREGVFDPARPTLAGLVELDPVARFAALYRGVPIYEASLPLRLNDAPFGSIRLGVSTTLLKRELNAALWGSVTLAAVALPLAWLAAMGLAHLILRPIRALAGEVGRLRRGEFDVAGLVGGDEFQELSSQLRHLGQELEADRLATLGGRAHLQHVVDQLEDGVIFLNPEWRIVFFNRAAESVVGRPLEQAVGAALGELLGPTHPLLPLIEQAFAAGGGARNATLRLPADGGGGKEYLVSVFFVSDARQVMGVAVLLKDLESVKTVQSLVSYSAKLAALGRLTSGIAHEVKNPLNAMMIHLELLREKLESAPGDVQQSLDVIGSEIRRLDRVVQGFLKFMRPQELAFKALDASGLAQSVVALLEAEWRARGVRFAFQLDPGLPLINADEELLRQAFLNILQNACQAMPRGGTVTVGTGRDDGECVRVSVTDEGVGIPPEDLEKIFRLYYTTKPDGNGIGLAVAYRIVQMHDGAIEARSEVGRGTTMTVRLPLR
jgi:signal transduction histidine kinase